MHDFSLTILSWKKCQKRGSPQIMKRVRRSEFCLHLRQNIVCSSCRQVASLVRFGVGFLDATWWHLGNMPLGKR